METCLSLLERDEPGENRLLVAVMHDPREALYMGGRIIILGKAGEGIVFDKVIDALPGYGSAASVELEMEIIRALDRRGE